MPVIEPYFTIGQFTTVMFFLTLILMGFSGSFEQISYRSYNLL